MGVAAAVRAFAFVAMLQGMDAQGIRTRNLASPNTGEDGTETTFEVRLTAQPTAVVTVVMVSSDTTEGKLTSPIVFDATNWKAWVVVTVTGQDDEIADGDVPYSVELSIGPGSDSGFVGASTKTINLNNVDNGDSAAIAVGALSAMPAEGGNDGKFTVKLTSRPSDPVTVCAVPSSDEAIRDCVTFAPSEYETTKEGVVKCNDDSAYEPTPPTFSVDFVVTGDTVYSSLPAPASFTGLSCADDDTPGLRFESNYAKGDLHESAPKVCNEISLLITSRPTFDVRVCASVSNDAEGKVVRTNPNKFPQPSSTDVCQTFQANNKWKNRKVFCLFTKNDGMNTLPEYDVIFTATSGDSNYDGLEIRMTVQNIGADVPMIIRSYTSFSGFHERHADGSKTSQTQIQLGTQPTANVELCLTSSDTTELVIVDPASSCGSCASSCMMFTASNWDEPQTMEIESRDDDMEDGRITVEIGFAVLTGPSIYRGLVIDPIIMTNGDGDSGGYIFSALTGELKEEGETEAEFTVKLNTEPLEPVTICPSSSDSSEMIVDTADCLTFTKSRTGTDGWNVGQTVTVTAVDDALDESGALPPVRVDFVAGAFADWVYRSKKLGPTSDFFVEDNDQAEVIWTTPSPAYEIGTPSTFSMSLKTEPSEAVTVTLSIESDDPEGIISPSMSPILTFTPSTWSTPQPVTIDGVDDEFDDGDIQWPLNVVVTSGDEQYNAIGQFHIDIVTVDDEIAGLSIGSHSPTLENGPTSTSFSVQLNTLPLEDVFVAVVSTDLTEGTVSPAILTFTRTAGSEAWNEPHVVTVDGQDDSLADGHITYDVTLGPPTSPGGDPLYPALAIVSVRVTNMDDDVPSFTVSIPADTREDLGGDSSFTVTLDVEPVAPVTLAMGSSHPEEGTVPNRLIIQPADWNQVHTVVITRKDDYIDDGDVEYTITVGPPTGAPEYLKLGAQTRTLKNIDNEDAGISVSAISGNTFELGSGKATFTVGLTSQPRDPVTLALTSNDTSEGRLGDSSLVFLPEEWPTRGTVTVTGWDDSLLDGNVGYQISAEVDSSDDAVYSALIGTFYTVDVVNIDDDVPSFTVTQGGNTREDGTDSSFSVKLNRQPNDPVVFALQSSDTTEATVPNEVVIKPEDWTVGHDVTITAKDDTLLDGDVTYTITVGPLTGDASYAALSAETFELDNIDDEVFAFTVTPGGNTSEADGGDSSFTVQLNVQPVSPVTIALSSSDVTEATVVSSFVIAPEDWLRPHSIIVHGEDDPDVDGDQPYDITVGPFTGSPLFTSASPVTFQLFNLDDDDEPVSSTSGGVDESSSTIDVDPSGTDECKSPPASTTCYPVGQNCVDRNYNVRDDWLCFCPPPSVGTPVKEGVATCEMPAPDCSTECASCENDLDGVCRAKYTLVGGRDNFSLQRK